MCCERVCVCVCSRFFSDSPSWLAYWASLQVGRTLSGSQAHTHRSDPEDAGRESGRAIGSSVRNKRHELIYRHYDYGGG